MRTRSTFIALIITTASSAQLINGSFESNGAFDYTGWQFVCNAPIAVHDTPPGGDEWSAHKEIGNVKGCWPSYLYQPINFAQSGEVWTLSTWTRSDTVGIQANASVCFGHQSGGFITLQQNASYSGFEWTYITITDTIVAGPGVTPVAILNPGVSAGPTFGAAWFDNVHLVQEFSENVHEQAHVMHQFMDDATSTLFISTGDHIINNVLVFDITGRALPTTLHRTNKTTASIDAQAFSDGVYIVQVSTDVGEIAARFVKR